MTSMTVLTTTKHRLNLGTDQFPNLLATINHIRIYTWVVTESDSF